MNENKTQHNNTHEHEPVYNLKRTFWLIENLKFCIVC